MTPLAPSYVLEGDGPSGTVRLLVGRLSTQKPWTPLEEAPQVAVAGGPGIAVVPDDQGLLRGLLGEVSVAAGADTGDASGAAGWRRIPIAAPGVERKLGVLLDELPLRPWLLPRDHENPVCAVVPLSEPSLRLLPIHRAITGVKTFEPDRFLILLREYAQVYDLDGSLREPEGLRAARERMAVLAHGHHVVLLVLPGGKGKILRFRQAMELDHVRAAPRSPTLRSLDLALLNALVLRTVVGLEEPGQPGHPNVQRARTLEDLVAGVEAGDFQAGFGLNPPPVWEVRAVIEAAQQLPPGTLRLEPQLPLGLL